MLNGFNRFTVRHVPQNNSVSQSLIYLSKELCNKRFFLIRLTIRCCYLPISERCHYQLDRPLFTCLINLRLHLHKTPENSFFIALNECYNSNMARNRVTNFVMYCRIVLGPHCHLFVCFQIT